MTSPLNGLPSNFSDQITACLCSYRISTHSPSTVASKAPIPDKLSDIENLNDWAFTRKGFILGGMESSARTKVPKFLVLNLIFSLIHSPPKKLLCPLGNSW